MGKKRIAFHTLGCKLNFSETSSVSKLFNTGKFEVVGFDSEADIFVINTCAVTKNAEKKCRQAVNKIHNLYPDSKIAVVGCYSQLKPDDFKNVPGVALILGTDEKFNLPSYVEKVFAGEQIESSNPEFEGHTFHASYSSGDRTRTFLKVQDGCDYFCSYCTIPYARGRSRNAAVAELIIQAKEIAEKGTKEVILSGINIGDFGKTTNESLFDLIIQLNEISGIERYRISSIEPNLVTDEIIDFIAGSKKFMPHFHIPLQSGNNKILKLMNRKYERELFAGRIDKIRSALPLAGIGTDVIVGFPGETKEDFDDTCNFIRSLDINFLHVFPYSERENTKAVRISGHIPQGERYVRSKHLIEIGKEKQQQFLSKNLNRQTSVLFESYKNGRLYGFTDNYIKVEVNGTSKYVNNIYKITLSEVLENGNVFATFET